MEGRFVFRRRLSRGDDLSAARAPAPEVVDDAAVGRVTIAGHPSDDLAPGDVQQHPETGWIEEVEDNMTVPVSTPFAEDAVVPA